MATAIPFVDMSEDNSSSVMPAKASFWSRAKARVSNIASRIASPFATAGRATKVAVVKAAVATKRVATKLFAAIKRTAKAVVAKFRSSGVPSQGRLWRARVASLTFLMKARLWTKRAWERAVRPFLKLRALTFAVIVIAAGLIAAPFATLVIVFGIGLGLWSLSYLVEHLEASTSRAARFALKALETIAQVLKGLGYVVVAVLTAVLWASSLPFAVSDVIELTLRYRGVRGTTAVGYGTLVFFVLTGQWGMAMMSAALIALTSRSEGLRQRSVDQQTVEPRANRRMNVEVPVIKKDEAPRMVKLPKCTACHEDAPGGRYGVGQHRGLCENCFEDLSKSDLAQAVKQGNVTKADVEYAKRAGVSVPQSVEAVATSRPVSKQVFLSDDDIRASSAMHNSEADSTKVYWLETGWWFDARSVRHTREWLGFVAGHSVACIEYSHERRTRGYTAYLVCPEKPAERIGVQHTLSGAQGLVGDFLSDRGALIGQMLDGLRDERATEEPAKVLVFSTPEQEIEHVRRTQGDAAANALEERLLQEMLSKDGSS